MVDYLAPGLPQGLVRQQIPVIDASPSSLEGYGKIISSKDEIDIEIVRWPAQGWRPVDQDSGDEGGTTEGVFLSRWDGDILYGSNEAVGGDYILAYACEPEDAQTGHTRPPEQFLVWHANYHPDGGQLFFPLDGNDYLMPLALPGDDVQPKDFVCFRFRGNQGCYIHPNIWHDGAFIASGSQRFFDRQGKVHARVSVDFAREFNCLLEVQL